MQYIFIKLWKVAALALLGVWLVTGFVALRADYLYAVEKEYIPFKIKEKRSKFIQKGWKVWLKEGVKGYRNVVKKKLLVSGKPVKEIELYKTGVLKEPEEAHLVTGSSDKRHPITVPKESYMHYVYNMEATAYDPSPESNSVDWAGITALGWRTRHGIAAVDPRIIALRRLIYVPGYGFAWTGDTGGDIKGKRIDLCYNTTEEALKWGRRKVKVYVLGTKPLSYYKNKAKKRKGK